MELRGRLKHVRWSSPAWMIGVVAVADEEIVAVGPYGHVQVGEEVLLTGDWTVHPQYGKQFKVTAAQAQIPTERRGQIGFLMQLAHLGRTRATALVEAFGDDVFRVIEEEPGRLRAIDGLTPARIAELQQTYAQYRARREQIVGLKGIGLTDWQVGKVLQQWGERAAHVIREHPYALLDVEGFGFATTDAIALKAGVDPRGVPRYRAAIRHVLAEARQEGHCYLPGNEVTTRLRKLARLDDVAQVTLAGQELEREGRIVVRDVPGQIDRAVYDVRLAQAEDRVATFAQARRQPAGFLDAYVPGAPLLAPDLPLNAEQALAVALALDPAVLLSVITGGPGTGKTTITRTIVANAHAQGWTLALCSPTGKAAKRLAEQAQHEAKTIHRTLGYDPETGGWLHNAVTPLEADLVLVDETSMVDVQLMADLVDAVAHGTRMVWIGDVDQLPSIGPGAVLRDVIQSGRVPVVRLHQVYRQSEHSYITVNAAHVRAGTDLFLDPSATDFFWHPCPDPEVAFQRCQDLVSATIPARHGAVDPIRDVHVLAPQRRGVLGIERLNAALQPLLNPVTPHAVTVKVRGQPLHVGDKVRHIRNDYQLMVMNGEVGVITAIAFSDDKVPSVSVDFGDRTVVYPSYPDLEQLVLTFAGTIHSAQGSEYPIVVVVCHSTHSFMLNRYLLYTAITRAQQAVYLVGDEIGLRRALRNADVGKRYTRLCYRLRQDCAEEA